MKARTAASLAILVASLTLTYAPLPGLQQTVTVVIGSELQAPLAVLEERFEAKHPNIDLVLKIQGSQDIVNNYLDDKNDFDPTLLIPASSDLLEELRDRWQSQQSTDPFYGEPQPIAKTLLVAIAWPERGKVLFPSGQFDWARLEAALDQGNWRALGGQPGWGSFDFILSDPARSNSGQLTLNLWAEAALEGQPVSVASLNTPAVAALFSKVKASVYQPPRSTDILLQEFISRGPNDADVATVYESTALNRWQQSLVSRGQPYQIYYLDRTIETVSTAAIARRQTNRREAQAAQGFIDFLIQPAQQEVFVQNGFRPIKNQLALESISNSPWAKGIPGAQIEPTSQVISPPDRGVLTEVIRLWQRAN